MRKKSTKLLGAVLPALLLWTPAFASSPRSVSRFRGKNIAVSSESESAAAVLTETAAVDPFAFFGDDSRAAAIRPQEPDNGAVLAFLAENDLLAGEGEQESRVSGELGRKEFAHAAAYSHCHTAWGTYYTNTYATTSVKCVTMWGGTWDTKTTAPVFQDLSVANKTATSFDLNVDLNQSSTVYAVLLETTDPAPSSAQVKAGTDGSNNPAIQTKSQAVTVDPFTGTLSFSGLDPSLHYLVYLVGENGAAELTPTPQSVNPAFAFGTIYTTTSYYVWPKIEVSDNGNFYALYWNNTAASYTFSKWNEATDSWGAHTAFSSTNTGTYALMWGGYNRADFTVSSPNASTDNLHIVFSAGPDQWAVNQDPRYGLYNGSAWSFAMVANDVDSPDEFDIFLDNGGKIHTTYTVYDLVNDGNCANDYYRLRYDNNVAGAFPQTYTTVRTNPGCDSKELGETHVVRESGGITHIFFGSEQNPWWMGFYQTSSSDGYATQTLILDSCPGGGCPDDSSSTGRVNWDIGNVIIDAADKIHMVYSDQTNGRAYYRTNKSGSWVVTELTTAGRSGLRALDLTIVNSNLYVMMGSNEGHYLKAYDGTTWFDGNTFSLDGFFRQFAIDGTSQRVMILSEVSSNPYKVNYHTGLIGDYVSMVPPNTPPSLGGTFTTAGAVNDNATIAPFSGVTVSDADGDNVSISITSTAANGTLSGTGLTGGAGNYTVTAATPATATANLQGLVFTPTANQVAAGSTVVTTFTLTPNDGTANGTADSTTRVTATSINDNPVITSNGGGATASAAVNENTAAVTTVTATDVDPATTLTYAITGGADAAKFSINSGSGALTFATAPDFENPADSGTNNVYDVQVTVTDNGPGALTDTQAIAVTVTNVNDAPVVTSNGGGATASVSAAENQTAVTTVIATDQDPGDTLTYSISGGTDQALFSINSTTGVLTFASAPNYESPADSGANNVYDVQVTVTDNGSGSLTDVQAIAVTVTNVNETPVITSNGGGATASTSINENTTAVTTVTATDPDVSDTLTYSISGGTDQALFSINSTTGVLTFTSAPNYESPADSGANNVYDVQVTVTDNGTGNLTDVQDITVTVNNVNEAPSITSNGGGATASVNADENQTAVTTVIATDQDPADTLTYSISGGADQALFSINSSTGVLTFASAANYESPADSGTNNVYDVQVTVTDNGTGSLTDTQAIAVTVTNVNESPVITSNGGGATASTSVNENSTAVTTVSATDQDPGDTLTYSISGGADLALFSINSGSGALTFASAPDYENPTDSGGDNIYDVQVTVTDNGTGTLSDVQNLAVTVNNSNDAPVITSNGGGASASVNAAENQTAVTTVVATDQDAGDTLTYTISGGSDAAKFSINSATGELTFVTAPDFENPADSGGNNVYDVQVTVTDNGTVVVITYLGIGLASDNLTDVQAIAVTVTNVNETPVITSNGGGATASTSVNENSTTVTTVTATDPDPADTLTYSITGGADQARFSINSSSGALTFVSAPNYESPADSGANNVYDVQVAVTDNGTGNFTDVQDIAVTVNDVNDAPVITSNGGGATASINAAENQTAVTTVTATDQDPTDTLTYSISGGADQALFTINSATGVLTFASAPNYESPTDSGGNNVYDVQVTVIDNGAGNLTDVQAIAVTVIGVNENPVITSNGGGATASTSVNENSTAVTTVTAMDPDVSDTLTYSISGGADAALFSINSGSGVLAFATAPDFESPTDSGSDNVYDVQVTVTDNGTGNLTDVQDIAVTVDNANDAPVITSNGGGATASVNAAENQTTVTTVTATDQDAADTLTYSISGGADQALFSINSATGVLTFASAPDYEAPADSGTNNVYDVQMTVTDNGTGSLTDTQDISVTVTGANENPVITSDGGGATALTSINENSAPVTMVTAVDPDSGDTLSYSISGGVDAALFSISTSGALAFAAPPDFEDPTDVGANNIYDVQVKVTDSGTGNLTDTQAIAVTVTNVNECPEFTGTPTVHGDARIGRIVNLDDTGTADPENDAVTMSYQWQLDGVDILGAINQEYWIAKADLGKTITCVITADDGIAGPATFTTAGKVVGRGFPWLILMPSLESPNKVMEGSK